VQQTPELPKEFDGSFKRRGAYAWEIMKGAQAAE
jgi:hypothetical protein